MKILRTLLFIFSLITSVSVLAQRERNYIYLLDCTKSMTGYGGSPNIWEPTKQYLKTELGKHSQGTTFHVIPFQDNVFPAFNFKAEDFKWKDIEKELDKIVQKITNTNICDAWDAIDQHIDSHKDNYVILLTDGKDNVKGRDALAKKLSKWCNKFTNTYAFYVQLTEAAIDEKVAKVINLCENEFVVDATKGKGIPVFGGFEKDLIIYANTLNLERIHLLGFSSVGTYSANTLCNDPYFDVKISNGKIEGGFVPVQIVAKKEISAINAAIPQTYNFTFDVCSDEIDIINPTVKVQMTNKPERSLETISEETSMGEANWYDSFLFWNASIPDTLSVDLKAKFNAKAKKDESSVVLQIKDSDGNNDFQLLYNNQPIDDGCISLNGGDNSPSVLSVVFNSDAKEGARYLTIKVLTSKELDKINDLPLDEYELTLRSEYDVDWNPLKTVFMWLGILILAALLLWFILLKHLVYPTINVKYIQINDPYFSKVNVKGTRRVVFTNKDMRQGIISRIFTGAILYKKNDVWNSPLTFEAGSKKRTLRVIRNGNYVFDPFTSNLKAPNDYVIENVNDKTKIFITIN